MNKTILKTVAIAAAVVWVANNTDMGKQYLGGGQGLL